MLSSKPVFELLLDGVWPELSRELEYVETPAEREAALQAVRAQTVRRPGSMLVQVLAGGFVGYLAVPIGLRYLALPGEPLALNWPSLVAGSCGFVVTSMAVAAAQAWFFRKRARRILRRYLNAHGVPVCERCGYCLRGQATERCPECGSRPARLPGK